MSDLLDGTTIPWDFISGKQEPLFAQTLPPPVRRAATRDELQRAAELLDTAQAANWRVLTKVRAMATTRWTRG